MKEDFLRKLGLSSYEIKVFLTLFQTGQTGAREISKVSSIPYGRIYDVLYSLEQKGLVTVIKSEPKSFVAIEPTKAVEKLIETERLRLEEIEEERHSVIKEFDASKTIVPPSENKEKISVYYGSEAALNIGRIGIIKARKEILINTTRLEDSLAQGLMAEKMLKGVALKVMIPKQTKENSKNIAKIRGLGGEVRTGGIEGMKIGIADGEGTVLTVANPRNLKGSITIVVEGKSFAKSMRKFFLEYWNVAKNL